MDKVLSDFGMTRLSANSCDYSIHQGDKRVLMALSVDDMFMIGKEMPLIQDLKTLLHGKLKMKDLGAATFLLGLEIRKLPGRNVHLLQEKFLAEVLERFPTAGRHASTPLIPGCKPSKDDSPKTPEEIKAMLPIPYRSTNASLMYILTCTRPDILAAVSSLSRFNSNPGIAHWEGVQHILRYLQGTRLEGLEHQRGESTVLRGYCDSGHLTCPDTGRSRRGFVIISAGAAISWQSKLQSNASLSFCESEYMGFSMVTQEVIFLRNLQMQMRGDEAIPQPVEIIVDSQPAQDLVNNPLYHSRTKQILARYHFVRDRMLVEKEIVFKKIASDRMAADMLTKHASVGVIRHYKKLVGMQ